VELLDGETPESISLTASFDVNDEQMLGADFEIMEHIAPMK